jgi:hypothetical protein
MKLPKRVSSGRYIDLNSLTPEDVDISDISRSLNYIYRFTGHHKDVEPLTVAQHTLLTTSIAKLLYPDDFVTEFDCLMHDMPEAYYGDVATPLKNKFGNTYRDYVLTIDSVVYNKLWVLTEDSSLIDKELYKKRKTCDGISLDIERRIMWKDQRGKDFWPTVDSPFSMKENFELFKSVSENRFVDIENMYNKMVNTYWNMQ